MQWLAHFRNSGPALSTVMILSNSWKLILSSPSWSASRKTCTNKSVLCLYYTSRVCDDVIFNINDVITYSCDVIFNKNDVITYSCDDVIFNKNDVIMYSYDDVIFNNNDVIMYSCCTSKLALTTKCFILQWTCDVTKGASSKSLKAVNGSMCPSLTLPNNDQFCCIIYGIASKFCLCSLALQQLAKK